MDVVMAGLADHEGFASSSSHDLHPAGLVRLAGTDEVGECADVMNLNGSRVVADLAPALAEPGDELASPRVGCPAGHAVGEDRVVLSPQWDAAEPCDQGWLGLAAVHTGLEAPAWPVRCAGGGPVSSGHLGHRRVVLPGQRFEQRAH